MARIAFSNTGKTPFMRLLGHNQEVLHKWNALEETLFASAALSPELIEQVRRTLAFGNGCEFCMAKGRPDNVQPNLRQSLAVSYAQMVLHDHTAIEDSAFAVLREEFTEEEIAELTALICFITASQMFGAIMQLRP